MIILLFLTILSVIILIVGVVWALIAHGQTSRRSGPAVGAEIMADQMADDSEGYTVAQQTFFKGKATEVNREASISFADIKHKMRTGQTGEVVPFLLAMAGFVGLFLFGSLTAFVAIGDLLIGGLIVAGAFYAIIRMAIEFIRA